MLFYERYHPVRIRPEITWGLIFTNLLVSGLVLLHPHKRELIQAWGYVTGDPSLPRLFTSQFLHSDWFHLAGNLYFLWVFGDNVEEFMGRWPFLFFYLVFGAGAAMGFASLNPGLSTPLIGASGAISGVMGVYVVFFPKARLYIWVRRVGGLVSAAFGIVAYGALQFGAMLLKRPGAGVAYEAHAAGLLLGVLVGASFRGAGLVRLRGDEGSLEKPKKGGRH